MRRKEEKHGKSATNGVCRPYWIFYLKNKSDVHSYKEDPKSVEISASYHWCKWAKFKKILDKMHKMASDGHVRF